MTYANPFDGVPVDDEAPEPYVRMASEKQEAYIRRLINDRDLDFLPGKFQLLVNKDEHTFDEAKQLIDELLPLPKVDRDPPEGIHYMDGTVYKVQVAHQGSGRRYAKRLFVNDVPTETHWDYIGRNNEFWKLSSSTLMALEDAMRFGQLYGVCCVCGAILTDETSIRRGIGPVCEGRMS